MTRVLWTPEQDAVIVEGYAANLSCQKISEQLGVTRNAVIGRAGRLRLTHPFKSVERLHTPKVPRIHNGPRPGRKRFPWPEGADAALISARSAGKQWKTIAHDFGCSAPTLYKKAGSLGLIKRRGPHRRFTSEEISHIRSEFALGIPVETIASALGRDTGTVRQYIHRAQLRRGPGVTRLVKKYGREIIALGASAEEIRGALHAISDETRALAERAEASFIRRVLSVMDDAIAAGVSRNAAIKCARASGLTLEIIGQHIGVTRERIRQIVGAPKYPTRNAAGLMSNQPGTLEQTPAGPPARSA